MAQSEERNEEEERERENGEEEERVEKESKRKAQYQLNNDRFDGRQQEQNKINYILVSNT
jgi:hypothetical protein